jgi:hypothetical protein
MHAGVPVGRARERARCAAARRIAAHVRLRALERALLTTRPMTPRQTLAHLLAALLVSACALSHSAPRPHTDAGSLECAPMAAARADEGCFLTDELGWSWDGTGCTSIDPSCCAGADCDRLYPSAADCLVARSGCDSCVEPGCFTSCEGYAESGLDAALCDPRTFSPCSIPSRDGCGQATCVAGVVVRGYDPDCPACPECRVHQP